MDKIDKTHKEGDALMSDTTIKGSLDEKLLGYGQRMITGNFSLPTQPPS